MLNPRFSGEKSRQLPRLISNTGYSHSQISQCTGVFLSIVFSTDLVLLPQKSQKAFLSYVPESRSFSDYMIRGRINLNRTWTFDFTSRKNLSNLITPAFSNRNYAIVGQSFEPRVSYTRMTTWRIANSLKFEKKSNQNDEQASVISIITEAKYNLVSNAAINMKINLSNIQYNGNVQSTIAYVMLDGLRTGNNGVWVLDLTKRISKFIELNIMYEGRKSVGINIIHLGRAQIRALL
ncbi:MAG: hypothetical protein ACKOBX_07575 [Bacteroidota bacterium]